MILVQKETDQWKRKESPERDPHPHINERLKYDSDSNAIQQGKDSLLKMVLGKMSINMETNQSPTLYYPRSIKHINVKSKTIKFLCSI